MDEQKQIDRVIRGIERSQSASKAAGSREQDSRRSQEVHPRFFVRETHAHPTEGPMKNLQPKTNSKTIVTHQSPDFAGLKAAQDRRKATREALRQHVRDSAAQKK